ncbi:MAG TPA: glycoside hydrolase family 2 TIM barrel-domain containing protein [Bacteroidota bacterium]|nr:glycoside hydrolase family 2 TIM barrel-domain containing protein [Bacteroidota bacterium]
MPKLLSIALVLLVSTFSSIKAQENFERKQRFDNDWKFRLGDSPTAGAKDVDDGGWRILDLPHDWSIEGNLNQKNPTGGGGGYFPAGIGWYRKTFTVPPAWKEKCVSIYFEGVYMNSEVFLNGKSLGIHPYGYTAFSYDLSSALDFKNENVVSVRVDNSRQPNCRWYSGSGIYRHVWLVVTDPVHVANWGVAVTTPEVAEHEATVQIRTRLKNETDLPQKIMFEVFLTGANSTGTGAEHVPVDLPARGEKEVGQNITVSNPLLWTPEVPHLCHATVRVLKDGRLLDATTTTFGIRSIRFSVDNGFQLNGTTVKINGGCVHHDNGCLGAAAFDRAEERRVELLKAAGFNAVRTSHNPPSEAFLDACDSLGMMVMDEAFDGWRESKTPYDYALYFDAWWRRDVEAMVLRDRNHPSIVCWSIGNEIIERKKPQAVETARMLASCVRLLDPTRPFTSAMTTWDKEWEIFDTLFAVHDIGGYNYQLHRAPSDHKRVPARLIVQTESFPRDAFSNWKMVQGNGYIIGDFVWTALDYLGESGIGRWYYSGDVPGEHWERDLFPWHAAYCGDIDLTGWRKPISHYRDILYNGTEKLYLAVREPSAAPREIKETLWSVWPTWESWSWPGYEGKELQVEVYSRYPKVRLYLNAKLIGEQATAEEQQFKATLSVPYAPGELRAVGVVDSKEVESAILRTAGPAAKVRLVPDRTTISATGQDLSFVTVEVTDSAGTIDPNATNQLQFSVDGPGVIAGVGNADIKDLDSYVGTTRRAWHGRALAVVRGSRRAGTITLTVRSPGLSDAQTTINVENSSSER